MFVCMCSSVHVLKDRSGGQYNSIRFLTASKDIIVASGISWLNETARLLKKEDIN